ncbi:EutP/PduV family microcompartment system protein [Escherichia coli]|uniref:EutP/PduV family microcompartment system protein n=1 Tax=Escherichia coli TaxID=562 RepID=UPI003C2D6503
MNHPVIGVVTKADLASMEQISLVKSWLREAGAHNVLVTSAVNNNGEPPRVSWRVFYL